MCAVQPPKRTSPEQRKEEKKKETKHLAKRNVFIGSSKTWHAARCLGYDKNCTYRVLKNSRPRMFKAAAVPRGLPLLWQKTISAESLYDWPSWTTPNMTSQVKIISAMQAVCYRRPIPWSKTPLYHAVIWWCLDELQSEHTTKVRQNLCNNWGFRILDM